MAHPVLTLIFQIKSFFLLQNQVLDKKHEAFIQNDLKKNAFIDNYKRLKN